MNDPRSSWFLISLTGIALVAGGYFWGQRSLPRDGARVAAWSQEVQEVVEPGAVPLQDAVLTARAGGTEAPLAEEPDLDALDTADVGVDLEPEDEEQLAEEARAQHFDELSRRIDAEVVDGAWRHATEGPLRRLMTEHLGPKVRVAEATCASTHCRVKLDHPEWSRLLPGWTFAFDVARAPLEVTDVQYDNRKEGATTLYFKRGRADSIEEQGAP